MARLKNVTEAELKEAEDKMFEASQLVADLHRRASQGYAEKFAEPISLASSFLSASRTLADMAHYLLLKAALQEQERSIEAMMTERMNKNKGGEA